MARVPFLSEPKDEIFGSRCRGGKMSSVASPRPPLDRILHIHQLKFYLSKAQPKANEKSTSFVVTASTVLYSID